MYHPIVNYPIEESVTESWRRFDRIYNLTTELAESDIIIFHQGADVSRAWKTIADVWESYAPGWGNVDIFYEALFHNCFRRFSSKVSESKMLKLVLLVEDELLRCGYAFNAWKDMPAFRRACNEILYPNSNSESLKLVKRWKLRWYLHERMLKRVMLKDKYPEEWGNSLDCTDAAYPYSARYLRSSIERYEDTVKFLLPEAEYWDDKQWADEVLILQEIKEHYGVDYTDDLESLNNVLAAIPDRYEPRTYFYHLYCIKDFPEAIAKRFWEERYDQVVQECFLDIYKRYRRAKDTTKNSRYRRDRVMNGWIYKQIEAWYNSEAVVLSPKVKKAYFNVTIGA